MTLTLTQQAELMLLAAEAARLFVQEFAVVLNPATTDWDQTVWADACQTLPWIPTLLPTPYQEAWDLYDRTLIAETARLVAWSWRVFAGDETRQVDGVRGCPAVVVAWYAEPKAYEGDVLYSPAFTTRAEAEAWADRQLDADAPDDAP